MVSINEELSIDIDRGIEIKIVYNQGKQISMLFGTAEHTYNFKMTLWNGECTFQNCLTGAVNMGTLVSGTTFILKIYRKDEELLIDVNGHKSVEISIHSTLQCSSFWGREISRVYFAEISRNVATHFRLISAEEKDGTDENDYDAGRTTVKLVVSKPLIAMFRAILSILSRKRFLIFLKLPLHILSLPSS